ncbi:hypothetical protein [Campylobacter helveticus]|uniref:hypothetical protein n=1 Tax=Campylobacter helveticus TaxID=28898 RepID=UPI001F0F30BD|nr:hypothetical protein [Campylobacter helveticus]
MGKFIHKTYAKKDKIHLAFCCFYPRLLWVLWNFSACGSVWLYAFAFGCFASVLLGVFWINRVLKFSFILLASLTLFLCFFGNEISLASQKAQLETLKSKESLNEEDRKRFNSITKEIEDLKRERSL